MDGFAEDESAVEVVAFTVCVSEAVLGVPDVGVNVVPIVWLPAARVLVVNAANPLVTATPLARTVLPSVNDAVPAAAGVTVAVNVTLWLAFAGFSDEVSATVGLTGADVTGSNGNVALV